MLKLVFVTLAIAVFLCGSGIAQFEIVYCALVLLALCVATVFERRDSPLSERLLLGYSATLLTILIAELGLRVVLDERLFYRSHEKFFEMSPDFRGRYRYVPLVSSSRTIYGDLAAFSGAPTDRVYRQEDFSTDSRGFRNAVEESGEETNVVILGDSFAAGSDTTQGDTWAQILGAEGEWKIRNLALPGSPADELYVLITELPNLVVSGGPTLVWMIFSGNDLTGSFDSMELLAEPTRQRLGFLESIAVRLRNFRDHSALSRLIAGVQKTEVAASVERRVIPNHGPMLFFRPHMIMASLTRERIERLPAYLSLRQVMRKMKDVCDAAGISVLVVMAPSKEEVYLRTDDKGQSTAMAQVIEGLSREFLFDFLDLGPVFMKEANEKKLWWSDDTHWNAEGNRVAANAIAARLRQR